MLGEEVGWIVERENGVATEHRIMAQKFRVIADGVLGMELVLEPALEMPVVATQLGPSLPPRGGSLYHTALERVRGQTMQSEASPQPIINSEGSEAGSPSRNNCVEPTQPPSQIPLLDPPPGIPYTPI